MANLVPKVDNTGSLGTSTKKWGNVHTTTLSVNAQSSSLSLNSQKITNLAAPTAASDAATKSYVDSAVQGLSAKDSVRVATTANGALASAYANGQIVDGVTLSTGDRILIKDQTAGAENGIYTVNESGAPTRAIDFDSNAEVEKGAFVFVEEGTSNANAGFVLTTDGSVTLGTTALSFTQFSGAGDITAGDGLVKSGNTLSVDIPGTSAETTVADDDLVLVYDSSESALKKMTKAIFVSGVGGISNLSEDTTPQLGGSLDVNGQDIVSVSNSNITLTPNGSGVVRIDGTSGIDLQSGEIAVKNSGSVSNIKLYCEVGNAHYTQIQSAAHSSYSGNVTLTLPTSTGILVGSGDTGTVTNTMLAGSITNSKLANSAITVTAGNGLAGGGSVSLGGTTNLTLDLNELTPAVVDVANDHIVIVDANDSNASKKESVADLVSGIAGTGLSASSGQLSIADDAVTYAKIQNVSATDKLLGRLSAGAGVVEEIACTAAGRALLDDADAAAQRTTLGLGTGDSPSFTSLSLSGGTLAMNSQKITGLATPTADGDAATKSYVDSVAQGLSAKDSVRVATIANGTLSTAYANGQSVDGITLATGDRILIKDQTAGAENGVYTVNASGAPTRAVDFDADSEVEKGAFVFVEEGTTNADSGFVLTTDGSITLDTTALSFTQFSGAGDITAGDALTKSGNTLNVAVDDSSIEVSSDALRVKAAGITSAMLAGSIANSKLNTLTTANKVALSALDLDGGTDIGADLVDADLIVVDDGAGGTNRKSTLSRIKKYIFSSVSGDATATDSGAFTVSSGADFSNVGENILPSVANSYTLGSATAEWADLYLGDASRIYFGNDQDVFLEHNSDLGLTLDMGVVESNNEPVFKLVSQGNPSFGPSIRLDLDKTAPLSSNRIGSISFTGKDDGGNFQQYGLITCLPTSDTNGSEVGEILISPAPTAASGTSLRSLSIKGVAGDNTKILVDVESHNGSDAGLKLGGTLITSTAAELNLLDGVTATTAEINLLDGGTSATSTTLVDADRVIVNDAGTMKQVALSDVKTYVNAGGGSGASAPTVVTDSSGTNTTISTTSGIEEVHLISNGANAVTITLPAAATAGSGYKYNIKRLGTANVTIDGNGSETIDGQTTFVISSQYSAVTVVTDGSNWHII
jgi:hypothetical protein